MTGLVIFSSFLWTCYLVLNYKATFHLYPKRAALSVSATKKTWIRNVGTFFWSCFFFFFLKRRLTGLPCTNILMRRDGRARVNLRVYFVWKFVGVVWRLLWVAFVSSLLRLYAGCRRGITEARPVCTRLTTNSLRVPNAEKNRYRRCRCRTGPRNNTATEGAARIYQDEQYNGTALKKKETRKIKQTSQSAYSC